MPEPTYWTATAISKYLILSVWSAFGGMTHTLVEKRKGRVTTFFDGLALTFISGFAGMMWGLVAIHYYGNDMVVVAFGAGMGGFMSLEGMAIIINYGKKKAFNQ